MKHGKKYRESLEKIDRTLAYSFRQGVECLLGACPAKFDETAEVAMNLGVDPRHADQNVRGALLLPHGIGKVHMSDVWALAAQESR